MILLDADVLVDVQRGYPPAVEWFAAIEQVPSIPGFVAMELIQNADNKAQLRRTTRLIEPLPIVWPTEADCYLALATFQIFHLSHSLGLIDSLIGACAVGQNATLYTFNRKHYRIIADLKIEQPYAK